jgi:hypothetical protein
MAFNPDEIRDTHGRWTAGGAGAAPTDDPRVLDVEGDDWNKKTATRLEKEYAASRGALDTLAKDAANHNVAVSGVVEDWDSLTGSGQDEAATKFVDDHMEQEYDNEVQNWHENGDALRDAKQTLASDNDWKHEALTDFIKARDEEGADRIPYSPEDLGAAIEINGKYDFEGDTEVTIDDSKLRHPDSGYDPNQLTLPGVEPRKPEDSLTADMRKEIIAHFTEAFDKEAENKSSDVEPPEYLKDSAKESLEESWSSMDDDDKYEWTKKNTDLIESHKGDDDADDVESGKIEMPTKFDPMNETSGEDYKNTQRMARYLSVERGIQLLRDRGIFDPLADNDDALRTDIAHEDHEMWDGWKGASANDDGKLIQVASAEEFGGRLNKESKGIDPEASKEYANSNYKSVGGYEGVKALMRAKWEATQYMLDRANMPMVDAYRGVKLANLGTVQDGLGFRTVVTAPDGSSTEGAVVPHEDVVDHRGSSFTKLPDLAVVRNGASSWTTDLSVANGWSGGGYGGTRVVLRAQVPRTSILSVPAYGINVHSEHEVVVLGAAWKNWDAWYNRAPKIDYIAMKPPVAKTDDGKWGLLENPEKDKVV